MSRSFQVACVVLVAGATAAGGYVWLRRSGEPTPKDGEYETKNEFPLPKISPTKYLNTSSSAEYIGSDRCQECHSGRHESFVHTAHSRSLSVLQPDQEPPDATFDHPLSRRRYKVYRKDGQMRHKEILLAGDEELELSDYPLKYLVGSGRFSRSYLAEVDGFLIESPITWFASLKVWRMSPGYDETSHSAFNRTMGFDCLYCHTGTMQAVGNSPHRMRLGELAIGCERCHGPGSLHVKKHAEGGGKTSGAEDLTIVNPDRLSRDLAESICYQCHLSTTTRVSVRGRHKGDFRPGLPWQDFYVDYTYPSNKSDQMNVTGHVEQLRLSRCYQETETLSCLTCHDPHENATPAQRVAQNRATCVKCHEQQGCGLPLATRTEQADNDCVHCHMPQTGTDISHIAFTHHRIGIHESRESLASATHEKAKKDEGARPPDALTPLLDVSRLSEIDRRRNLGLACMYLYRDEQDNAAYKPYLDRAEALLRPVAEQGLRDSLVEVALGQIAGFRKNDANAEMWLAEAAELGTLSPQATCDDLHFKCRLRFRKRQYDLAARSVEKLCRLRRDFRDWALLGVCRTQLGQIPAAKAALQKAIEIDPGQPGPYVLLGELYRDSGDSANQAWCERRAALTQQNLKEIYGDQPPPQDSLGLE